MSQVAAELGQTVPPVCSYFAGMTKYGVDDPVAVCIVPYLDQDRRLAMEAAAVCPHSFEHPENVIRWILSVSEEQRIELGKAPTIAQAIIQRRNWQRHPDRSRTKRPNDQITLPAHGKLFQEVSRGDKLLVVPRETADSGQTFEVFTLPGISLGRYVRRKKRIPDWWKNLHLVDSEVYNTETLPDGTCRITIVLTGV